MITKVRLTAVGTRPLMMHNVQLASPLNEHAKRVKVWHDKRNKTEEDRIALARVEWEGGMYFDPELGPYLPSANLLASLIEGARLTKAGKKIERGVAVTDFMLPIVYRGPRDLDGMWGPGVGSRFVDIRPAVVQRNKVDRCRPVFREWTVEAEVTLDSSVIEVEEFTQSARNAGTLIGVGDYRRAFGRFKVTVDAL